MKETNGGIQLPTGPKEASTTRVSSMVIISRPKVGKTEALLKLPDSLLIDYERSASFFGGNYMDVEEICLKTGKGPITVTNEIADLIDKENKALGRFKYKFGIIDSISKLEEHCEDYATKLYTQTNQGKSFTGKSVVNELEYGAGFLWLRTAFSSVITPFFRLFEVLIMTSHVKDSSINLKGTVIATTDINLTGKIKSMIAGKVDANAMMYRHPEKTNVNMLSFITTPNDLMSGARPPHLSGKEFLISEKNSQTGELITHWDKIFLDL